MTLRKLFLCAALAVNSYAAETVRVPGPGGALQAGGGSIVKTVDPTCVNSSDGNTVVATIDSTGSNLIPFYVSWSYANFALIPAVADLVGGQNNGTPTQLSGMGVGSSSAPFTDNTLPNGVATQLFWFYNPAHTGASHAFTVTAATGQPSICIMAFSGATSGIDGSNFLGTYDSAGGTTYQPGSVTFSAGGAEIAMIAGGNIPHSYASLSIDSSFTGLASASGSSNGFATAMAYRLTSPGAVNPTWTDASQFFYVIGVNAAFK